MILVLSPAKALDFDTPLPEIASTQPRHLEQAAQLAGVLRKLSVQSVAELMDLSDKLAALNVARYQSWRKVHDAGNARQAMLAFDGDVYDGLRAREMNARQLHWAQDHVRILSGLYGVLRPLDLMQPYRLEMGTSLAVAKSRSLYGYWGSRIARTLNEDLAACKRPVLLNLASQEYFKSVDRRTLDTSVVECVFQDYKSGSYKVISFLAKRARGLMARHIIERRIDSVQALQDFDAEGYAFDAAASTDERLVFRRRMAA